MPFPGAWETSFANACAYCTCRDRQVGLAGPVHSPSAYRQVLRAGNFRAAVSINIGPASGMTCHMTFSLLKIRAHAHRSVSD